MRLPNGYGGIHKLSGNRRKPWCVRKTVGWELDEVNQKERPLYKYIGYFATKKEALQALADYNSNPYDVSAREFTLNDLYEEWSGKHFDKVSDSNISAIKAGWKVLSPIHEVKIQSINLGMLQEVFDNSGKNKPTLRKSKVVLGQIFDYAVSHEYVGSSKREIVRHIEINADNPNAYNRKPFSKDEIDILWKCSDGNKYISVPLILIYTGLRISELLELRWDDIHLAERWFFVKESKTESGIREVPIAEKIVPFFEMWYDSDYLITTPEKKPFKYRNYYDSYWKPIMEKIGVNHRPHDTRHTCISLLTSAGVDSRIIKQIVGHKGLNVTEAVYTHLDIKTKLDAINKI